MPVSALSHSLQQLLQDQNPLLLVLEEMADGVLMCDTAGRLLMMNKSLKQVFGLDDEDLLRPLPAVIAGDALQAAIDTVLASGNSVNQEMAFVCDNQQKIFDIHIVPLVFRTPDSAGVNGCVAIFHDMTAIRRTEKMRRDFVANVSHELRTPLSAIKGYAETLLEGALDDGAVARDFVDVIHRHSVRLTQLVADLLDLSKLESPDFEPLLKPLSLKSMVERVLSMVEKAAEDRQITLSVNLPDTLPRVMGNASNLEQVFTNLLDNAIKYTPAGGRITLSAKGTGDSAGNPGSSEAFVQFSIADTGIGIEPKHIPRLFERFYRVDKARSREMGGTGLGLSIVKHIIQYHGGDIWVESEPNQGSTFHFTLRKAD